MKLFAHQLVAEALPLLNDNKIHCLPVYEQAIVIGKVTYAELNAFVNHIEKEGLLSAAKLQLDLKTALPMVIAMELKQYKQATEKKIKYSYRTIGLSMAALIVLSFFGFTFFFFEPADPKLNYQENILHVDSDQIVLTLSNGMQLPLDADKEGLIIEASKLTYKDGSIIFDRNANEETRMMVHTSKMGIYQITLADGTKVWLNASSRIEFPSTFSGSKQRRVRLSGEAYFEVAKMYSNKGRIPFIVVNEGQVVEVLGTHFNVKAHPNTPINTTLLEGSVRVTPLSQSNLVAGTDPAMTDPIIPAVKSRAKKLVTAQSVLLSPNQEATLMAEHILVKPVDAEGSIAWTKTDFTFRNMPLEKIMSVVSSWYHINVVYEQKTAGTVLLGGSIQRADQLSELLATLEQASNLHFRIQGNRVTVINKIQQNL